MNCGTKWTLTGFMEIKRNERPNILEKAVETVAGNDCGVIFQTRPINCFSEGNTCTPSGKVVKIILCNVLLS